MGRTPRSKFSGDDLIISHCFPLRSSSRGSSIRRGASRIADLAALVFGCYIPRAVGCLGIRVTGPLNDEHVVDLSHLMCASGVCCALDIVAWRYYVERIGQRSNERILPIAAQAGGPARRTPEGLEYSSATRLFAASDLTYTTVGESHHDAPAPKTDLSVRN
jgi:hypothetical protein